MKRIFRVLTLLGCIIVGITAGGSAWAYTFNMGAGSTIDTSATIDALYLDIIQMNPALNGLSFNLEIGQTSAPFFFARVGTTESWVNSDDDLQPRSVTAFIDFDSPNWTQGINGSSVGFAGFLNFTQGWKLEWTDPVRIITSFGLDFTVDLSNASFSNGWWQGPEGTDDILATVTLNAVPAPAAAWLLGSGLIGLVAFKRRRS
jgi:hypothetical protein